MLKSLISLIIVFSIINSYGQEKKVVFHKEENQKCFKCHGQARYVYFNPDLGREVKERMNPYRLIHPEQFYVSNHKSFRCTDCHSEDYDSFPHPSLLRFEPKYTCMDCHGGDDTYAKFNFEKIEAEFLESVHSSRHTDDFSCWMCHDAHNYRTIFRNSENLKDAIAYDNAICLNCHANIDNYQLLTNKANPDILKTHDWLPNQKLHFGSVRCIECHAIVQKDILVAHQIKPKKEAVKNCVECHSQNSILLESLYRYELKEKVNKYGFLNARMLTDSYLIGANRNQFLNIASVVIFLIAIGMMVLHLIFRIIYKSN